MKNKNFRRLVTNLRKRDERDKRIIELEKKKHKSLDEAHELTSLRAAIKREEIFTRIFRVRTDSVEKE